MATAEGRGLVHVVDRVLFPPTVGDVVQTLQVVTLIVDMFFFVILDKGTRKKMWKIPHLGGGGLDPGIFHISKKKKCGLYNAF